MPALWPDSHPAMSFAQNHSASFWGVLINPDKSASPLLEQLCLGIAQVLTTFDNYAVTDLTPERLATFYRKVGGNYDVLFLDTKPSALSFIYQRLGCFHSIQPSTDPYKPPSIPALQPHGFVRWQTIQLLLDPDEHVHYLQRAVEKWNIRSPNGSLFPKNLPRDAFPAKPDPDMIQWHETVSQQFEIDYWKKNLLRSSTPGFSAYQNQFGQKESSSSTGEDEFPAGHHQGTPNRRHVVPTTNAAAAERHRRRQSAEIPPTSARNSQSALPRRSAELVGNHASPRAPSPPNWSRATPKPRGRERMNYSRPASPEPVMGHSSSDASSEDSGSAIREEPSSPPANHGHYRHLSPPHSPSARRHSHEAYSRRPQRELSPDSQRRFAYRDAYNSQPSRPYDSDSGRKMRHSRLYTDDVRQSRTPGPAFGESATVPTSPVYAHVQPHVQPRFVNVNNTTFMVHPHPEMESSGIDESRRNSHYRSGSVTPNPNGASSASFGRARFSSMSESRPHRWSSVFGASGRPIPPGLVDAEYSRRPSMYDR